MIVSFDPGQRAFCSNNRFQTQVFAKHLFAVLALDSSPPADLVSGDINTPAVDSLLLSLKRLRLCVLARLIHGGNE